MSKYFDEELNELKMKLVNMCRIVEGMIDDSVKSLIDCDIKLAESVVLLDSKVDEMELDIEKNCMRILLKQQPVANDFRIVSTILKVITDIERIGDQSADIASIVKDIKSGAKLEDDIYLMDMCKLALKMVKDSVNSFIYDNEKKAKETIELDNQMDNYFIKSRNKLIELIRKNSEIASDAIMFLMIIKYLERIGDHAVNVCEWTNYINSGVHKKY